MNSAATAANIEAGNTVEIRSAIKSRRGGMQTLEQALAELVRLGHVTVTTAREHANDTKALERHFESKSAGNSYR